MSQTNRRRPTVDLTGPTDEQIFAVEAQRLNDAGWDLPVHLNATAAIALISLVQLACRHPGVRMGGLRQDGEYLARELQQRLAESSPELGRLLERGWHEVFDVSPHQGDFDAIEFDDLKEDLLFAPTENPPQNEVNP